MKNERVFLQEELLIIPEERSEWFRKRLDIICAAMSQRVRNRKPISPQWFKEYNEMCSVMNK